MMGICPPHPGVVVVAMAAGRRRPGGRGAAPRRRRISGMHAHQRRQLGRASTLRRWHSQRTPVNK